MSKTKTNQKTLGNYTKFGQHKCRHIFDYDHLFYYCDVCFVVHGYQFLHQISFNHDAPYNITNFKRHAVTDLKIFGTMERIFDDDDICFSKFLKGKITSPTTWLQVYNLAKQFGNNYMYLRFAQICGKTIKWDSDCWYMLTEFRKFCKFKYDYNCNRLYTMKRCVQYHQFDPTWIPLKINKNTLLKLNNYWREFLHARQKTRPHFVPLIQHLLFFDHGFVI